MLTQLITVFSLMFDLNGPLTPNPVKHNHSKKCDEKQHLNYSSGNVLYSCFDEPIPLDFGHIFFPFISPSISINDLEIINENGISVFQIEYENLLGLMLTNFPDSEVVDLEFSYEDIGYDHVFLYFDYVTQNISYSFTSENDCKVEYYREYIATDIEKYILGLEEVQVTETQINNADLPAITTNFQNFVYAANDANERDYISSYTKSQSVYDDRVRITGDIHYVLDGITYPLIDTKLRIIDNDLLFDDELSHVYTNNSGHFDMSFDNQSFLDFGIDPCLEIHTENHATKIGLNSQAYKFWIEGPTNVSNGDIINFNITIYGEKSDRAEAFAVAEAVRWGHEYVKEVENGTSLPLLETVYPSSLPKSAYVVEETRLEIIAKNKKDWDVITHEYGHYINHYYQLTEYRFEDEEHNILVSPIQFKSNIQSVQLIYSESVASFHGLMAQKHNSIGNAFLGKSDEVYSSEEFAFFLNEAHPLTRDKYTYQILYPNNLSYGIGWERSLTPLLYQLENLLGLQNIWDALKWVTSENLVKVSPSLIQHLWITFPNYSNDISQLLADYNFTPEPSSQISLLDTAWTTTELTWQFTTSSENYAQHNFILEFYSYDFQNVYRITNPQVTISVALHSVTLDIDQLQAIISMPGNYFYWRIVNSSVFHTIVGENYLISTLYSPFQKIDKKTTDLFLYEEDIIHIDGDYDYQWFSFTAPTSDEYRIISRGEADLFVESFSVMCMDNRTGQHLDISDDDINQNFNLEFFLAAGETLYFRIAGFDVIENTESQIVVIESNHIHIYNSDIEYYNSAYHKHYCDCGSYSLEPHTYGGCGSGLNNAICADCGEEYSLEILPGGTPIQG